MLVYGTGTICLALEAFLGDNFKGIGSARKLSLLTILGLNNFRIYQEITPLTINAYSQKSAPFPLPRHPIENI